MKIILKNLCYVFLLALIMSCGNSNKNATTETSPQVNSTKSEDKYVGAWRSDKIEMKIAKLGETAYKIDYIQINNGYKVELTATLVNGNLETGGLNNLRFIYADGKLFLNSMTFEKVE